MDSNPQLEDGYTRFANELLEAFCRIRLAGQECQVVFAIARLTYGYGKKSDKISHGQISKMTNIPRPKVAGLMTNLITKKVLTAIHNGSRRPLTIGINKHYGEWKSATKKGYIPHKGSSTAPNNGSKSATNNGTHQRKKEKKDIPGNFLTFAKGFLEFQRKEYPNIIKKITEKDIEAGAMAIEELVRIDGHDFEEEIRPAINWAARDTEFWKKNLLSLASLRTRKERGGLTKFQKIMASYSKNKPADDEYSDGYYKNFKKGSGFDNG